MKNMEVPDIRFRVGDKEYALLPPSARIAFAVSRALGGIVPAFNRVQSSDLDAYFAILRAACPTAPQDEEELQQFVFENAELFHMALFKYTWSLQAGGKPFPTDEQEADEESDASAEGNAEPAEASRRKSTSKNS